jgi:hypothetical protein
VLQVWINPRYCHSACLQARRLARRGSDKRFSRSMPDMDISSPRLDFLLEKKIETEPPTGG